MQKSRSMILGLAFALAVPAAVMAQSQERTTTSGDAKNVTCRVTNLNSGEKSFTADCPEGQMTFTTTSSTQFTRSSSGASGGGATASMSDMKVGDQVRVTYSGQASGTGMGTGTGSGMRHSATRVEIMPSGGASQSGAPSGSTPGAGTQSAQTGSQYGSQQQTGQYGSQQQAGQQANRVQGRVASVDRQNRTLVIETDRGRETFKVEQSNTSVDFNSIREGEHVEIAFSGTGADRRITSLRMVPESMAQQRPTGTEQPAGQRPASQTQQPAEQRASQQQGTQNQTTTQRASQPQGQQNRVTGRVVNLEEKKLVIETSRGRETFQIDPSSATVDLTRFQEGDQVTVMYAGTGNERRITSIQSAGVSRASQRGDADEDVQPAGQRLPKTASEIPFIGLVGLFMLAAAFGLRYVRRHV